MNPLQNLKPPFQFKKVLIEAQMIYDSITESIAKGETSITLSTIYTTNIQLLQLNGFIVNHRVVPNQEIRGHIILL